MLTYAVGNLGYGTVSQTLNSFLMFFATSVLSLPGTLVGLAVAISVMWDGFSDPFVGYLSDKSKNKLFGKRINYMFFATFGIAIFNILIWIIPVNLPNGIKFAWLIITLLLLETFNTAFATPYVALGIDIAPDYNQQSSLQGFKTVFFILGMIMPSLLMFVFMPAKNGAQAQFNQQGYINIAIVTSAIAIIFGLICCFGCLKTAKKLSSQQKISKKQKNVIGELFSDFFKVLKSKAYGPIILGYSIALISSAFLTSIRLFTLLFWALRIVRVWAIPTGTS